MLSRLNTEVTEGLTSHYLTLLHSQGRHSIELWQQCICVCVCFPQSLNCTFGLALNKGKLSKVTSVRGWSQRAGRKWETRVWKMANGEVLDRIVESHYSPAALLYLSHKHFEDSTQKPEPSQLQMPALLGQIRGIGGIKERIKVKKKCQACSMYIHRIPVMNIIIRFLTLFHPLLSPTV